MGFVEIKEWIDKVVDNRDEAKSLEQFNTQIELNFMHLEYEPVVVHKGIDIVAAAIGEPLLFESNKCRNFDFVAYFYYRGCRFQQYVKHGELDEC